MASFLSEVSVITLKDMFENLFILGNKQIVFLFQLFNNLTCQRMSKV